jgi:hypothetical protein
MHLHHVEALGLVQRFAARLRASPIPARREVSIHPPFTYLAAVKVAIGANRAPVALGNSSFRDGAEVGPEQRHQDGRFSDAVELNDRMILLSRLLLGTRTRRAVRKSHRPLPTSARAASPLVVEILQGGFG